MWCEDVFIFFHSKYSVQVTDIAARWLSTRRIYTWRTVPVSKSLLERFSSKKKLWARVFSPRTNAFANLWSTKYNIITHLGPRCHAPTLSTTHRTKILKVPWRWKRANSIARLKLINKNKINKNNFSSSILRMWWESQNGVYDFRSANDRKKENQRIFTTTTMTTTTTTTTTSIVTICFW